VGGEKSDRLGYCWLKRAGVDWGVIAAVCREDLAEGKEGGEGFILETDIITPQTPSMIRRIEGIAKRKDSPNQGIIHYADVV